jgi:phosphohistidine swiveling domain-containing protein
MALSGYTKTCGKSTSGVKTLHLTEKVNVTSFTKGADRDYTAVTMNASAVFKKYEFDQDQCEFKESATMANGAWVVTQTIEFHLDKMSKATATEIEELADAGFCGMIGIVTNSLNTKFVVGYNEEQTKERPINMVTAEGTTGKALSDASGETITLTCTTTEKAYTFSGTIPV